MLRITGSWWPGCLQNGPDINNLELIRYNKRILLIFMAVKFLKLWHLITYLYWYDIDKLSL